MPTLEKLRLEGVIYLRDVPWRPILEEVFSVVCAKSGTEKVTEVAASLGLHDVSELKRYLENWRQQNAVVEGVLTWRRYTAKEMCEASRPGAWLTDVVYTAMLVAQGSARFNVRFIPAPNDAYVRLADNLGVKGDMNNSPNNLGNVLEFLTWLAFEEKRFDWIAAVGAHLAGEKMAS